MRLCQEHRIHLISDEIYGLSVFDTKYSTAISFTSVLSIDPLELIDLTLLHVFYGMSKVYLISGGCSPFADMVVKDFGAAGLRVGCVITRNRELQNAVSALS